MMLALAVLDLPFVAGEQDLDLVDATLKMVNPGPAIVFHEEVKAVEAADGDMDLAGKAFAFEGYRRAAVAAQTAPDAF